MLAAVISVNLIMAYTTDNTVAPLQLQIQACLDYGRKEITLFKTSCDGGTLRCLALTVFVHPRQSLPSSPVTLKRGALAGVL